MKPDKGLGYKLSLYRKTIGSVKGEGMRKKKGVDKKVRKRGIVPWLLGIEVL